MSDDNKRESRAAEDYFNLHELIHQKQVSREKDDADLRAGRVTAEDMRLRNGLFSGIDLSKATIRRLGSADLDLEREILARVSRMADCQTSTEWYRSFPISALGGRTAEQLVKDGNGASVLAYLDRKSEGAFD